MNPKLLIAGAIVAIIVVCAAAAAATLLGAPGQAETQQSVTSGSGEPVVTADDRDNGTLDGVVDTAAAAGMPSVALGDAPQAMCSISGKIIEGRGSGLANIPVTLHLMGYNYSGDQIAGTWEVGQLTTTTGDGADAGRYSFDDVIVAPDMQFGYVSSYTTLSNGMLINGLCNNFTLTGDVSQANIVLPDPQDVDPDPV